VRIHLAAKHALQFELADLRFDTRQVAFDLARRAFVVLRLRKVEQFRRIPDGALRPVDLVELAAEPRAFLAEFLRLLRLLPDRRILELAAYFLEPFLLAVVLKETPLRKPRVHRGP
jgi:hypothetical protein